MVNPNSYSWNGLEALRILTSNNKVFSYEYSPGANIQPIINCFQKLNPNLQIEELYIQPTPNSPMKCVTEVYKFEKS